MFSNQTNTLHAYEFEPTQFGIATVFAYGHIYSLHIGVERGWFRSNGVTVGVTTNTSLEWQTLGRQDSEPMGDFEAKHTAISMFWEFGDENNVENNPYFYDWDLAKPYQSLREAFKAWQSDTNHRGTFHLSQAKCAELDEALWAEEVN